MPSEEPPAAFGHDGEPAVRGVHVEPDVLRRAEIGQLRQRVDGAGRGGAGVRAHGDGISPGRAVLRHHARERVEVDAGAAVARHDAGVVRTDARDLHGSDVGGVALVAHVHGGALRVARGLPRRHERVQTRGGPSAREQPARRLRHAEPAPEPLDDDAFELARAAPHQPVARVEVVSGGEEVRDDAGPRGRGGDEAEAAGMVEAQRESQDVVDGPIHDVGRRLPLLRRILHEPLLERIAELPVPRALSGQLPPPPHEDLRRLPRQLEHGLGRHLEPVGNREFGGRIRHCVVSHPRHRETRRENPPLPLIGWVVPNGTGRYAVGNPAPQNEWLAKAAPPETFCP